MPSKEHWKLAVYYLILAIQNVYKFIKKHSVMGYFVLFLL